MQNITLTEGQQNVVSSIMAFIDSKEQCCVIQGHAGTGKTTVVKHVIGEYENIQKLQKIIDPEAPEYVWEFTATTNKAVQALTQATGLEAQTVHKLLNLTVRTNYSNKSQYLVKRKGTPNPDNRIIVIDECSYIDQELLDMIETSTTKCKVIFMGDPSQLTPVNSDDSPVFVQGYPTFVLHEVVRQVSSSPIQKTCADLRETIQNLKPFPKIDKCFEFTHLSREDFDKALIDEFTQPDWDQSQSKILAWTNKTVEQYNNQLMKICSQRTEFRAGDYVINNHYVQDLPTDAECQILKIIPTTAKGIKGYQITLDRRDKVFMPKVKTDIEKAKNKAIADGDYALAQTIDRDWVDLRAAYACTINKSQGSTYNKVYIDLADLGKCKDVLQLARLLYVGISRAKTQVIFTGDI